MAEVDAGPRAGVLVESMRDIGYSLESALADVIDNSISARATEIHILADTTGPEVVLGILDDGSGMDQSELIQAMRLGSKSPKERRAPSDLGRFGLGLKTASFSQCRRLSVVTRKGGKLTAAVWDLDHVQRIDEWKLQLPDNPRAIPFADQLVGEGSLVVWQRLDRALEGDVSQAGRARFIKRLDEVRRHLELAFHRYLSGEPGHKRVAIRLNNTPLTAFDPYHSSHTATQAGPEEVVQVGDYSVTIRAYTLPHHRNVSAAEWERFAGHEGYLRNQGFYLYRERRLIIHGTWFGLARQAELTKLCRVRLDIPNGLDEEWAIDVKKSSARPPAPVRDRLKRIIEQLGAPSRRVYTARAVRLHDPAIQLWQRVAIQGSIHYRLNLDNEILKAFIKGLGKSSAKEFQGLTEAIGAALPVDAIFADLAGSPEAVGPGPISDELLEDMIRSSVEPLRAKGISWEMIHTMLHGVEPFRGNWDRTEDVLEGLEEEE